MTNVSSTADDILACARSLIIAGGYNGFSYADVADVVGIRKPKVISTQRVAPSRQQG